MIQAQRGEGEAKRSGWSDRVKKSALLTKRKALAVKVFVVVLKVTQTEGMRPRGTGSL